MYYFHWITSRQLRQKDERKNHSNNEEETHKEGVITQNEGKVSDHHQEENATGSERTNNVKNQNNSHENS